MSEVSQHVIEDYTGCEADYDENGNPVWYGAPVIHAFQTKDALIEYLVDLAHDSGLNLEYRKGENHE